VSDSHPCPSCGADVPAGAAFCTSCGSRLGEPAAPPAPGPDPTMADGPTPQDPTIVAAPPSPAPGPWAPPGDTGPAPAPPAPPAPAGAPTPPAAAWPPPAAAAPPAGAPPAAAGWPAAPPTTPAGAPGFGAPPAAPAWGAPAAAPPWDPSAAAGPSAPTGPARSVLGGIAAVVGGALTILGVFSGWVTLGPSGNTVTDSAWSLTSGDGFLKSNDPYLLLGLGIAAVVVGLLLFVGTLRPLVRIAAIIVGVAIVVTAALNWSSVASFVTDNFASDFEAKTAIGFYLVIAGGIVTAVAALLPAKSS